MSECILKNKLCKNDNCISCFNKSFMSIGKHKFIYDKNINSRNISKYSNKITIFKCIDCDHNFEMKFSKVSIGQWCPYCAIPSKLLCDNNDCIKCHERSFLSHEKSKFWDISNKILPRKVFKNSNDKYIFLCNICNHNFEMTLLSVNNNYWCPFCSHTKLCDDKECIMCFNNSFASHHLSKLWSKNNKISPRSVFIKSNDKYLLDCYNCNHEIISRLGDINDDLNCPYCASKKLCNHNNCDFCYNKSFASHDKSVFLSSKNKINPRNIFKCSSKKLIFDCNVCNNEFSSELHYITSKNQWCMYCLNKTEKKLYKWLKDNYKNISFQINKKWSKRLYRYDFILEDYKIIIELDGPQHFNKISNWEEPIKALEKDVEKINNAINNNYNIIHILQYDVFNDKNNWEYKLKKYIKIYDITNIIFINNNDNIYINHIKLLEYENIINDIET